MGTVIRLLIISMIAVWNANCVTFPPSFTQMPNKQEIFIPSEASKLPCVAVADPPPKYKWFKNGVEFNFEANVGRYTKWPDEGTLVVAKPGVDDDGIYQCVAENMRGRAMSVMVDVRRAELAQFTPKPVNEIRVQPGVSITVKCSVPLSYPQPVVSWQIEKRGQIEYIKETNRLAFDLDGNLHIASISAALDDGAFFTCTANNWVMRTQATGEKTKFIVTGTERFYPVSLMYRSPQTEVAIVNDTKILKCIIAGNPVPGIVWAKDGKEGKDFQAAYPNMNVRNSGTELEVKPVNAQSAGLYTCRGNNEQSNKAVFVNYNVFVKSRPVFTAMPIDTTVPVNGSHTFVCRADGDPTPKIQWTVNGRDPGFYLDGVRKLIRGDSMILTGITSADIAVIQCNASNSLGYVYTNAFINMMEEPPQFTMPPQIGLKKAEGQEVNMTCQTFSAPKARIVWTKDNNVINGGRYVLMPNGDLYIKKLLATDAGTYVCTASNPFGARSSAGNLTVRQRTTIRIPPIDTRVYENQEVKFLCTADTDPIELDNLVVQWSKDNNVINYAENPRVRVLLQDNSLIISGAQPRDTGQYTCNATNGLDNAEFTASLVVQGRPDQPITVTADCVTEKANKLAVIKWNPGSDNYAPIIEYVIEYSTQYERDTWYLAELTNGTRTGDSTDAKVKLRPHIQYQFRARARNRVGLSEPSIPASSICMVPPEVPSSNPTELYVYGTRPNNLIIQWTTMTYIDWNANNLGYQLTVQCLDCSIIPINRANTTVVADWRQDRLTYDFFQIDVQNWNVETFKRFRVTIKAKNDQGESSKPPLEAFGYSGETAPTIKPSAITVLSQSPGSALLSWTMLQESDMPNVLGFFRGYRVEWCDASLSADTCELQKRYQDFIMQTTVAPIFFGRRRRRRSVEEVLAAAGSPSARLTHSRRLRRSLPVDSVLRVAPQAPLGSSLAVPLQLLNRRRRQAQETPIPFGAVVNQTLTSLPGAFNIRIWSRIINLQYCGPPSDTVTITTVENVPGPVSEFRMLVVGVNHVVVAWTVPTQTNGVLVGYQLGVCELMGLELGYLTRYPRLTDITLIQTRLAGLKPNSYYRVFIWPQTSAGDGIENFIDIKTAPADTAPTAPTFTFQEISGSYIVIAFEPSTTGVAGSVFYAQYMVPGRAIWQDTNREFINRVINITGLVNDTYYMVRMVSTNGVTMTSATPWVRVKTGGPIKQANLQGASATWFILLILLLIICIILLILLPRFRQKRAKEIYVKIHGTADYDASRQPMGAASASGMSGAYHDPAPYLDDGVDGGVAGSVYSDDRRGPPPPGTGLAQPFLSPEPSFIDGNNGKQPPSVLSHAESIAESYKSQGSSVKPPIPPDSYDPAEEDYGYSPMTSPQGSRGAAAAAGPVQTGRRSQRGGSQLSGPGSVLSAGSRDAGAAGGPRRPVPGPARPPRPGQASAGGGGADFTVI